MVFYKYIKNLTIADILLTKIMKNFVFKGRYDRKRHAMERHLSVRGRKSD